MFAYVGTEGYMLECELREGKQHCQNGTPDFLKQCLQRLDQLGLTHPVLWRLDSGNDSYENIQILQEAGYSFLIKRNLRQESKEQWLSHAPKAQKSPCLLGNE